ncbi:hypothetical protein CSA56_15040 [candidate division KSB3 bacterium]|uniref:Periplasmic binding protein domain-containing protein n=1 Tax=candidate division KSB3 bacterium TaxID=2044937 RepID=A0A2G6KA00_9BACT|nr:MAG: hypothetical protein CSA56_15040 [candidate division KSB3 bacterium]
MNISTLKMFAVTCLLVVVVFFVSYADEVGADETKTFAIMVKRADEPWFQVEAKGFEHRAEELGVKALVMDNKMDPNVCLTNVDTAIAQGVSGIAIVIPDQKMSKAVLAKANAAGIPMLAIDDVLIDQNGTPIAPYVGMDTKDIGYQVGTWLAEQLNSAGWLHELEKKVGIAAMTFDTLSVCKDRTDNSRKALLEQAEGLNADMFYPIHYKNTDAVGSFEAMQSLLTQHPDVTHWLIYACNDEGVVGAVRALEQAGKDGGAIGCGLGAGLAKGEFEKTTETAFKASIYLDSAKHGAIGLEHLYNFVTSGTEIPMNTTVPGTIVTRENYQDVMK